ncbi:glucose-1-phosphate adenylyltransferase family protein [candidate division CSSED10-310 bacterium]|uniref:Glucose-1-phosphate adenylyltransferase family protein n=1 Tax=candidate division CSSED10-310 bacterium TaxID=2855610 RepID=A0ABV6YXZ1_UNCC1
MKQTLALVLAGGVGSRLGLLSSQRAKPAVPFGGTYRLIDFTLSNAMHSDVKWIGILTQYRPASLMDHISTGQSWNFIGPYRQLKILPPQYGRHDRDWYQGTADAIYQNLNFIKRFDVDLVLILSGDHIYKFDYNDMIAYHRKSGADLTIAGIEVPRRMISEFGIIYTDTRGRIVDFVEKPAESKSRIASMGVYVFRRVFLETILKQAVKRGFYDFGKHIIPHVIGEYRVFMYPFSGYWRDVGTITSYWQSNLDTLRDIPEFSLASWQVMTNPGHREHGVRAPTIYDHTAKVVNSSISKGCSIQGEVVSSILSPGVQVHQNAKVCHSVVFHDTVIAPGAQIHGVIVDKNCRIGENAHIGQAMGEDWDPLTSPPPNNTVIAKGSLIPADTIIDAGSQIDVMDKF